MITVIIAGGSGTRLWPLSTPEHPKHLLKLTGERSLLQTAYDRASKIGETVYVVTEASHSDKLRDQLPELPDGAFLIEPGRRGTAHCIVFALDAISRKHDHDEPIAFIHSDHYVRNIDGFANSFKTAANISTQNKQITLIGVEPTSPSTAFGYIQRGDAIDVGEGTFKVESFKEKPDFDTAKSYLLSGNYLWNCGYFVGSVNIFLDKMKVNAPGLYGNFKSLSEVDAVSTDKYNDVYLSFDSQPIDTALIEKTKDLSVVTADFDWMDVGSFKELHEVVDMDINNNHFSGKSIYPIDVQDVYVRNEEDKPIAIIGLNDIVVVNTPDGILVSRKDVSHRTGEVAKILQDATNRSK
ncbi:MAG: mannose-1-phosphate guanylyltransferase [Candidatus Saccharibacteria bacterium]